MPELLLESAIRATLAAAALSLVLRLLRIQAPAVRHAVWTAAVIAMLLLPAAAVWLPKAPLVLLPEAAWQSQAVTRFGHPTAATPEARSEAAPGTVPPGAPADWTRYLAFAYAAGFSLLLARLAWGTLQVWKIRRSAVEAGGNFVHPSCRIPITIGWLRPTVILPPDWLEWPRERIAAVLAHEGEHARRRDPLVQWLALLNRAVFWFHPLAWWLERKLSGLAEEACDEAVLAAGQNPYEYSEILLEFARHPRMAVQGLAMPGPFLPRRVRQILAGVRAPRVSRLRAACLAVCCATAVVLSLTGVLLRAQIQAPAFEVATIKPNTSGTDSSGHNSGNGRFEGRNLTLRRVLEYAYEPIQEFEGGPDWVNTARYDIRAQAEGLPPDSQIPLMLRSLLADRFKLVVHRETRDRPAYALVLARADGRLGPSVKPVASDARISGKGGGQGARASRTSSSIGTMESFAESLRRRAGRVVVDRTGLEGRYEINLSWEPDELGTNAGLFTALQEQAGLKLEPTRAPVAILVIDSVERPTEN